MIKMIGFELSKQLKRKENLLLLFMFLLPLFYSIGVATHSSIITYNSDEPLNALSFSSAMYLFVDMLFIFYLILAINSSNILRGEIDNGSLSMMLTRINDRKKLYQAKFYTQIVYWLILTCAFVIFSSICYYLFLSNHAISNGQFVDNRYLGELLKMIAIYSSFILSISIVQSVSMFVKAYTSIGIFIVTWVFFLYFKEFPIIKFFSPFYYLNQVIDSGQLIDFIPFMVINWSFVFLLDLIGINQFKRSDI